MVGSQWIKATRSNFKPSSSAVLCPKRFRDEDFKTTYNRRRLRPSAVSSVLDFPPHLQPKRVSLGHERRDFNENIQALIINYEIECESIEILEYDDINTCSLLTFDHKWVIIRKFE